jgi:hypothetical protein
MGLQSVIWAMSSYPQFCSKLCPPPSQVSVYGGKGMHLCAHSEYVTLLGVQLFKWGGLYCMCIHGCTNLPVHMKKHIPKREE